MIALLSEKLDAEQLALLHQLKYKIDDCTITGTEEQILAKLPQIQERLEVIANEYSKKGTLLTRRPIIEIRWNPRFWVKYGRRKFNSNPLQFHQDNLDVYGGMGRTELYLFDQGLYSALSRAGQLDEAIPENLEKEKLSPQEIKMLVDNHSKYRGDATKTSLGVGFSRRTVLRYWREAGLPIHKKGGWEVRRD